MRSDKVREVEPKLDSAIGDETGIVFPAHGDGLRQAGEAFLTEAFRAFGALSPDNRVTQVLAFEPCDGGSTGQKFFLTLKYQHAEQGLDERLFVKFSRDFTDSRRDHGRFEMAPEAKFAGISRLPGFPIAIPRAYFADYHSASGTGLIISQRIGFGEGDIEPHRRKCLDHELNEPLPYYRAIITSLARLAAAHKAGRLAPDIEARFPYDPIAASADVIRYDKAKLDSKLAGCFAFAEKYPKLLPAEVRTPAFLQQMQQEAHLIREYEAEIQAYLRGNHDLIALCHWNAHIDNAWFWRGEAGQLHCGLIDWGRVSQITMGSALWGALSAAHHDIWAHHLDELLELFVHEYHAYGGPKITVEELELHLVLHIAAMGVARVLAFPEVILFRLPEVANASGPYDQMFLGSDPARNCLHIYTVFLNLWRTRGFGSRLEVLLKRI